MVKTIKSAKNLFSILTLLLLLCTYAAGDIKNVRIAGDCTIMGMKIESISGDNGNFSIATTGGRFEYSKGNLKIYQGLDAKNRRLISTIEFDGVPNFVPVESNGDHTLFQSAAVDMGIYGDSTCIISPNKKLSLTCRGNFKPDYNGQYKGELLLIDELGGMEIYPQRYEAAISDTKDIFFRYKVEIKMNHNFISANQLRFLGL